TTHTPQDHAMSFSGSQAKRITEALCAAFPDRAELARMVKFGLNENLNTISQGATLTEDALALVEWADRLGRLAALHAAAKKENPAFSLTLADFVPAANSFRPPTLPSTFVN